MIWVSLSEKALLRVFSLLSYHSVSHSAPVFVVIKIHEDYHFIENREFMYDQKKLAM